MFSFRSLAPTILAFILTPHAFILLPPAGAASGLEISRASQGIDSLRAQDRRRAADKGSALWPAEAAGDIRFGLDGAITLDEAGTPVVELFLRVPLVALTWVRTGAGYRSDVLIGAQVESARGRQSRSIEARRSLVADSFEQTRQVDAYAIEVVAVEVTFPPGPVDVRVEDLRSKKQTLLGMLTGERKSGRCRVLLPDWEAPRQGSFLSTLLFASDAKRIPPDTGGSPETASRHGQFDLTPNPGRFYGLRQEIFPVYFEVYDRDPDGRFRGEEIVHRLRYRVVSVSGEELVSAADTLVAGMGRWGRVQRFSVEGYPSGTYVLGIELVDASGERLWSTYGDFHVIRTEASLQRDEQTILDDARVLLTPRQFEDFEFMSPGEREAFMEGFWERMDPSPGAPENELREEFRRRVAQAEQEYGGLDGGKLSDRGRILIRYGEADEVTRRRIPTLSNIRDVLIETLGASSLVDWSDPRFQQLLRRSYRDTSDFEIWLYYGGGKAIVPAFAGSPAGMVFVFVDEQGVGIYRLEYSTVAGTQ